MKNNLRKQIVRALALGVLSVALLQAPKVSAASNWVKTSNGWTYQENGNRKRGWVLDNGTWYYLNSYGIMETGWVKVSGNWYYLDGSGAMKTGWFKVQNKWYFANKNGEMKTDWVLDGNKWYFLKSNGAMATGWEKINNKWYFLKEGSGEMAENQFVGEYYVGKDGAMLTNTVVDGYRLDASGKRTKINSGSNSGGGNHNGGNNGGGNTPIVPQPQPQPQPQPDNKLTDEKVAEFKKQFVVAFDKAYGEYRQKHGLSKLERHFLLEKGAKIRADEMALHKLFSHTRPNGKEFDTAITELPEYKKLEEELDEVGKWWFPSGENVILLEPYFYKTDVLSKNADKLAKFVIDQFHESEGHRRNMQKSSHTNYSVDFALSDNGNMYLAFLFGEGKK